MSLAVLKKFQTYQFYGRKINQLEDKIKNYEKRKKFLCIGISCKPKLLEYDNNYTNLKRKLSKAQRKKNNAINSLATKLGQINQPLQEYENLLADLASFLAVNNPNIKNKFYDLLLVNKQLEEKYQAKCQENSQLLWENQKRERERERERDEAQQQLKYKSEYSERQQETIAEKSQEIIKLKRKITSLKGQITYYQTQDERLRQTIQDLQNENQRVIIEKNNYLTEFIELEKAGESLLSTYHDKVQEIEVLTQHLNTSNQAQNQSETQRNQASEAEVQTKNELADLEAAAQTYYQTSQQQLADTQQELEDTQQELENIQQAQEQAEIQARKKHNNLKKSIAKQGKKWKQKNQDLIKENLQVKKDLDKEKKQNQGKLKRIQQQLAKKRRQVKNLKQDNGSLKNQLTYYQDQDNKLRNTIQSLQNQINNHTYPTLPTHTCSPCSLVHLPEPHICPTIQNCSHEDYGEVKEQQIIQSLNEALGSSEKDLKVIISRIKELVDKPPIVREIEIEVKNTARIQELEKEIENWQNTPFGENLVTIKELELTSLEKLFKQVDTHTIQQIQQATSYQQVVAARQAFLEKVLENKQEVIPLEVPKQELITYQPRQERIIWISLLVVSLVGISGLLMKLRKANKVKK